MSFICRYQGVAGLAKFCSPEGPELHFQLPVRFGHLSHHSLLTIYEIQPFLMVLSAPPVRYCHCYLSYPVISHVISRYFSHPVQLVEPRPELTEWPASLTILAVFSGCADLPILILDCRAEVVLLLQFYIILIILISLN